MRINTNVASLQAQESNINTNKGLASSLEKLSTGLRINKAADDASGLAIADKLRTQATSLTQGIDNANSASALIQIADKALGEQTSIMDTVKQKLIQASTATTTAEGREAIRKDITKLLDQVDEIAKQTNYNGLTLLQNSASDTSKADTFTFQLGEKAEFDVELSVSRAANTSNLGGGADVFGASSINGSVTAANITAANAVGGSLDGSGTQHNNIGTQGTQQLSNTGTVSLTAVTISSAGTEGAVTGTTAHGIDVSLSGQIGTVLSAGGTAVYHMANQTQELKDFAKALAIAEGGESAGLIQWDATKEMLTATTGESVNFGDLEVSNLRVSGDSTTSGTSQITSIVVNKGGRTDADGNSVTSTFTVHNNVGEKKEANNVDDLGSAGQINVRAASTTSQLTGGRLLSDLKDLGVGELSNELANQFQGVIDEAIDQLNANRADFGSSQNQIQSSMRSMQTTVTNLQAAESVIRDVDYAAESASFNKQNIIAQAGTYAMSQANAVSQNVLRLLQ